jgi:hypothetical protein
VNGTASVLAPVELQWAAGAADLPDGANQRKTDSSKGEGRIMRKLLMALLLCGTVSMAGEKSVYDFTMNSIEGEPTSLSKFQGR